MLPVRTHRVVQDQQTPEDGVEEVRACVCVCMFVRGCVCAYVHVCY